MRGNTSKLLILLTSLAWISVGYASVASDWKKAQKAATWQAYQTFVSRHPTAPEAAEALRRMTEFESEGDWRRAISDNTLYQEQALETYLARHPGAAHEAEAKAKLREIRTLREWNQVKTQDSEEFFRRFARDHADSPLAAEALELADANKARTLQTEWDRALKADSTAGYRQFIARNPDSPRVSEAKAHIEDILDELEDTGLERTRQLVAQAKSLQAVPLQRGDFAKNLLVRATGSVLGYQGASVSALGEVYAKRPGQQGYEVVTPKSFVILSIIYAPPQTADVIAHNGKISWPVAYVVNAEYAMTLIIPAELIPCELEFVDALRTRIPLNSKPK